MIRILSKRTKIIKNLAEYKQKNKIPILQKQKMKNMFKKRKTLAKKLNINPEFIESIFLDITDESIKIQKNLINKT